SPVHRFHTPAIARDAAAEPEHQRAGGRRRRRRHPPGLLQGARQDHRQARIRNPHLLNPFLPPRALRLFDGMPPGSDCVADPLTLVAQYVTVSIDGSVPTSFAGSEEPAAYGEIMSIGGLGSGVNGKLSAALADILEAKLSVSASRFYVKFDDVQGYNVGFNGTTF
uniref:L-dopachrome isomerase n=1 Tax=Aegilops tauschii subsp. strangulata TaxID=200361 RepID=A0A453SQ02_AEGTS